MSASKCGDGMLQFAAVYILTIREGGVCMPATKGCAIQMWAG